MIGTYVSCICIRMNESQRNAKSSTIAAVLGLILATLDIHLKLKQLNFVPTGIPMLIIISWSLAKYLHQDEGYVHTRSEVSFRVILI